MTLRDRLLRYGISGGADNVVANAGAGGATFATDDIAGVHHPYAKLEFGDPDTATKVADATGQRVPVKVGEALPAGSNNIGDMDVLTLPAGSVAAVTAKTADYDTGAGTDTVPMFGVALPASGGAVAGGTSTNPVRTDPTGTTTQPVSAASLPLPTGASTEATLATRLTEADFDSKAGALTETAPATDTASSGLNGRLQRLAQRLTSLIALLPAALTGGGNLKVAVVESTATVTTAPTATKVDDAAFTPAVDPVLVIGAEADETAADSVDEGDAGALRMTLARALHANLRNASGTEIGTAGAPVRTDPTGTTAQPVSAASLPLPTGAATEATLATRLSESDFDSKAGSLTETAPATDTASSGLNGRLQRIAQRLTSLIALLPAALISGRFDVNLGAAPATVAVQGDTAHDAADAGNPVKIGLQARTTDAAAVASADRVNAIGDTLGKAVVLIGAVNDLLVNGKAVYTTTTAADLIAAQAAGVKIAITRVLVTNAHATVSTKVEIRDGTTVKIIGNAQAAGGGFTMDGGGVPILVSTAATAITGRCVTTGADVDIFVCGYTFKP